MLWPAETPVPLFPPEGHPPRVIFRAKVLASWDETPTVHAIRLEKPAGFSFAPVQFCGLEIETDAGSEEYPMSLACSPTRPHLEFAARVSSSAWKRAFRALAPGDTVEVDGAYGHFVLDEERPAVLVAGGIGITPLKGMLEYATDRALPIPVSLVYSNRTPAEIAYRGAIDTLAAANPRVRVLHTITRPEPGDGWDGRTGRLDEGLLAEAARGIEAPKWYVCGKPEMVHEALRMLRKAGVSASDVVEERFAGYG